MNPEPRPAHNAPSEPMPAAAMARAGMRRRAFKWLLAGSGLSLLAACGQRGPLYMPDPNDPTKKRS